MCDFRSLVLHAILSLADRRSLRLTSKCRRIDDQPAGAVGNSRPPAARRRACDGHHEMSDLAAAGELVHTGGESIKPVWPHRRRMVRASLREKDYEQDRAQFREPRSS